MMIWIWMAPKIKKDVIRKCSKNNSSDRCTLIKVNIPDRQIEDHHLCYSYEQNIIIIVEEYLLIHISNLLNKFHINKDLKKCL